MNEVQRLRLRATFHTLPLYLFYPLENYATLEIHPYPYDICVVQFSSRPNVSESF